MSDNRYYVKLPPQACGSCFAHISVRGLASCCLRPSLSDLRFAVGRPISALLLESKALPPKARSVSASRLSERVVARLAQAEVCESNPHVCDDLRIARLTVAYAASGEAVMCSPDVLASYAVLGLHPEKVWPAILARRKALGSEESSGAVRKKPPQSVKLWFENTNAARVSGSRGGPTLLRDNTNSGLMAAPSIAALYPNPDAPSSAKKRGFTYDEIPAARAVFRRHLAR